MLFRSRVALKQIDEVGNWIQPKWKRTRKNSFMQVENDIKNRSGGVVGDKRERDENYNMNL